MFFFVIQNGMVYFLYDLQEVEGTYIVVPTNVTKKTNTCAQQNLQSEKRQ